MDLHRAFTHVQFVGDDLQIIDPEYEDRTPLAFARLIEQALGGFTPPPLCA